jgi:hypothetical protein
MIKRGEFQTGMVMSDNSGTEGGARPRAGRFSKFKSILKGRRQFPVLLVMIVVLAIAMIYSLVTGMM